MLSNTCNTLANASLCSCALEYVCGSKIAQEVACFLFKNPDAVASISVG